MIKFFLGIGILFSIEACSGTDISRWTEEVKSWDGTVFKLEGRAEIGASGWPNAHRGGRRYTEYYHRPTKAYWRSPTAYYPQIFDLVNGVPIVVIVIRNSAQCYLLNYPEKSVLIFQWITGIGWQRLKSTDLPPKLEFNLMQQVFDRNEKKYDLDGFFSLDKKNMREGNLLGEFRSWITEKGSLCEKARKRGVVQTDAKAPDFTGFHGKPNF